MPKVRAMKRIFITGIGLAGWSSMAYAHGLHAPVDPKYHVVVHLLPVVALAVLAVALVVYVVRRRRSSK